MPSFSRLGSALLVALFLVSCRIEPQAVLGAGSEPSLPSCGNLILQAPFIRPVKRSDVGLVYMAVSGDEGLFIEFDGHGRKIAMKKLEFTWRREDGEAFLRKAVCKQTGGGAEHPSYRCGIENRGNRYDDVEYWMNWMLLEIDGVEMPLQATPRSEPCRVIRGELPEVRIDHLTLPSVIPSELKPEQIPELAESPDSEPESRPATPER